jgi:hypothetical protein
MQFMCNINILVPPYSSSFALPVLSLFYMQKNIHDEREESGGK